MLTSRRHSQAAAPATAIEVAADTPAINADTVAVIETAAEASTEAKMAAENSATEAIDAAAIAAVTKALAAKEAAQEVAAEGAQAVAQSENNTIMQIVKSCLQLVRVARCRRRP